MDYSVNDDRTTVKPSDYWSWLPHTYTKVNYGWTKYLNEKIEAIKFEENTGEIFIIWGGKAF